MAGSLAVDGLVSGLDTTALINSLMSAEAAPQTALKTRLTSTQSAASAYRAINTRFAALQTAADALSAAGLAATTAKSSASSVAVASAPTASAGSISFTVTSVASTHSLVSGTSWSDPTATVSTPAEPAWPIQVIAADGTVAATIPIPDGASLADAVTAINGSGYGFRAQVIQLGPNEYRLKVTAAESGAAGAFRLGLTAADGSVDESAFTLLSEGRNATLDLGNGVSATSATNDFPGLLPGLTVSVTETTASPVNVTVASDPATMATKMQALVDAANAALAEITRFNASNGGATAVLKGDFTLSGLTGKVLTAVSAAVGGAGSAALLGLQTTRDGKFVFKPETFTALATEKPDLLRRLVAGAPATTAADGTVTAAVPGIAARLAAVAKDASNTTTGSLTLLAKGRDSVATDLQERIDAYDLRLAMRRQTLTRQFTAMETALSGLKNQSNWLAGQLGSLSS